MSAKAKCGVITPPNAARPGPHLCAASYVSKRHYSGIWHKIISETQEVVEPVKANQSDNAKYAPRIASRNFASETSNVKF